MSAAGELWSVLLPQALLPIAFKPTQLLFRSYALPLQSCQYASV